MACMKLEGATFWSTPMQPLSLTLKGFRGIRDGLAQDVLSLDFERLADGAALIAIVGANGRGKTTVMDNMHPYLTMPSRAALSGPGGFSYYDHVCLPESEKQLTWAHEGRSYRSQVVIRMNGRRKTEAYIHVLDDAGAWSPVRLDDGLVSDGKVETYNRCVEAICGSADTFFTSVFSAQGKRQLSHYRNAEIKTLLSDLLGQDEIRALGLKASETAKLLKAGLLAIRQELAGLDAEHMRIDAARLRLRDASDRVKRAQSDRHAAQLTLEADRSCHARLVAEREQAQTTDARRAQLLAERKALIDVGSQAIHALKTQDAAEVSRLERLEQRVAARVAQASRRRIVLNGLRQECLATLEQQDAVRRGGTRLSLAERVLTLRGDRIAACRERVAHLTRCQGSEQLLTQRLAAIEQDAGKAALREQELAHRFGLVGEVPCVGSDFQGRCKLLADAREAQALIPSAKQQILELARAGHELGQRLKAIREQRETLAAAPQDLAWAVQRGEAARARVSRLALLSAKANQVEQARTSLVEIDQELAALGPEQSSMQVAQTSDEQAENQQIVASRQHIAQQLSQQGQHYRDALDRLDTVLVALPSPFDEQQLEAAAQALTRSGHALTATEQGHLAAERDAQALAGLSDQAQALTQRRTKVQARMARAEDSLGAWSLFARCMSNDGLIALAIDDAGPALSGLANDLLLACYGPRFTVSILTLVETGKGEQREGFDIIVHDAESGDSKSVGLMSGGERVWVNECLTRAVALYLAQHSGRCYDTLFSDEADGALDPERKRMFMAMKREVLRLGGYQREFYVSQTPELTAMADAVIDLDALRLTLQKERASA
jgi:exonuclease SbcC